MKQLKVKLTFLVSDFSPSSSIGSYKSKPNARRNPWGNSSYADLITMVGIANTTLAEYTCAGYTECP